MKPTLSGARRLLNRLPFTMLMLATLAFVALATNTHVEDLSAHWLRRLGFAPRDLLQWRWGRLVTSALVTSGGASFWVTMGALALTVGAAEWLAGTRRAATTFWGVHMLTLLLESWLVAVPLRLYDVSLGTALSVARDVGASAGYLSCLGLTCAHLPGRWRWVAGPLWLGLLAVLFLPGGVGHARTLAISANLAHAIAFPLGWLLDSVTRRRGPGDAGSSV